MPPLFTFRGYTAEDPLDRLSPKAQYIVTVVVAAGIALLYNYIQSESLGIIRFEPEWFYWIGSAAMTLVAFILVPMRKASSVFFYLVIVGIMVPVDLYLQAHWRNQEYQAVWMYNEGTFISAIQILPLRFFAAWSFDGIILGPVILWLARLIAKMIAPAPHGVPNKSQQAELFQDDWTKETVEMPRHDGGYWVLRLLGIGYFVYLIFLLVGGLGSSPWPPEAKQMLDMAFANPALLVNTFGKLSLMTLLLFIGAYNRKVRWYSTSILAFAHFISIVGSLAFYYFDDPSTPYRDFLMTSAIVDGVLVLLFLWIMRWQSGDRSKFQIDRDFPDIFSVPERLSRAFYRLVGTLMLLFIPLALYARLFTDGQEGLGAAFGFPDPMLCNALTLMSAMSALAFLLAQRSKLREYFFGVLLFGFLITVIVTVPWLLIGTPVITTRGGGAAIIFTYFIFHIVIDGVAASLMLVLRKMSYNVDYVISAMNPSSAKNVAALDRAFFAGAPENNASTLQLVDKYIAGIRGRKRGLLNFPFWLIEHLFSTVYGLHPSFSVMSPAEGRKFLRKYLLRRPSERARSFLPQLADLAYQIGLASYSLIANAHFSVLNNKREIGYVPPDARDRLQSDIPAYPPPFKSIARLPKDHRDSANNKPVGKKPSPPLVAPRVATPVEDPMIPDEVDYLVIGSGAGGATLAYRLACEVKDPSRIVVLERGNRYSPLQDFNDNEIEMIQKLYKEGGLQLTKKFDMVIMQGECVGGTTVINNAVCFPMPQQIFNRWQNEYGVDLSTLSDEYEQVAKELEVEPLPSTSINTRVKQRFIRGVDGHNKTLPASEKLRKDLKLQVNYRNEIGDGMWNQGNKRLRKRSMLETYIPWSEARGVQIVPNATAVRLFRSGSRADSVLVRISTGDLKRVKVRKAVIVAGGVIASSHFLIRSRIRRNVGKRVSCNFAFPIAFQFPDELDAFDGTQITLGALDPQSRAIFETYFMPPASFAVSVPFYFNKREDIMKHYKRYVHFGSLVGSEPNGWIQRKADLINGRPVEWELGLKDQEHIKYALSSLISIGKAAGAERVILPTHPGIDLKLTDPNIGRFKAALADYPLRMQDIFFTTAHPQGGNRMTGDGSQHVSSRVVDSSFRVEGLDNVYVADASVFPTGITVNPQWTIMALSSMAAKSVLARSE